MYWCAKEPREPCKSLFFSSLCAENQLYVMNSEADVVEKLPLPPADIIHTKASFPVSQKSAQVLHSMFSVYTSTLAGVHKARWNSATGRLCSLGGGSILGTIRWPRTSRTSWLFTTLHNCRRTKVLGNPLKEIAPSLFSKCELVEIALLYSEESWVPHSFDQQFVEMFSEFTSMDPEADQNHPLVLSTFVLAPLLTIPAQIKEKVVEWEEQTITQVLAAVTQFWDNIEKHEEEKIKNCCVYCSVKAIY